MASPLRTTAPLALKTISAWPPAQGMSKGKTLSLLMLSF